MVSAITETLILPYCWVCDKPKEDSLTEEHHIVPRHLGGEQGPTVTLCTDCHTKTHKAAESLYKGKTNLPYQSQEQRERCLYLAQVIVRARLAVEASGGLNKRFIYTDVLSHAEHEVLVKLGKHFNLSQKKVVRLALKKLYESVF